MQWWKFSCVGYFKSLATVATTWRFLHAARLVENKRQAPGDCFSKYLSHPAGFCALEKQSEMSRYKHKVIQEQIGIEGVLNMRLEKV